jgi:anti-sigma regulatory factor (Ser/Thr protein kinase)
MPDPGERRELVEVEHPSDVSRARTTSSQIAREAGFDEVAAGEIAICASELAQNIVDHGGGRGRLEIVCGGEGLGLCAVDSGPGLEPARAAARRERDPSRGEGLSSNGWRMVVVDGLGHGEGAHVAATRAVSKTRELAHLSLEAAMLELDAALVGTRGAVGALVELDVERSLLTAVCVGNVRVSVLRESGRWSATGTDAVLGAGRPDGGRFRVRPESVQWSPGDVIVAWSDGVSSRMQLPGRPTAVGGDPVRAALGSFGTYAQAHDDATLLVCA